MNPENENGLKLFILYAGRITNPDKGSLTPGRDVGKPFTFPVSMYVIDHPQGLVVFDTGMTVDHWPDFMKPDAQDRPEQRIDRQLIQLGYNPEDVKYVVQSHYHLDHCGGMKFLPKATFIIRREEAKEAWWPPNRVPGETSYVFSDFKDTRYFNFIELEDNLDYDVFGDGAVICIDTKGHTRGHQSLIVNLPKSGKFVIAVDAASLPEQLEEKMPPGANIWSAEAGLKSIERLRRLRDSGAFIILGHDPQQREGLKIAPEYYE
jgi:N-acyl homoserine lactone hydrolase